MVPAERVIGAFGWVLLALGAALLGGDRGRRIGGAGLLVLGLGLAAQRAGPAGADSGFLTVNGGLILLGLGLLAVAAVMDRTGPNRLAAIALIGAGVAMVGWHLASPLAAAGPVRAAGAAVALGLAAGGLLALGRAIASTAPARAAGRRLFGPPLVPAFPGRDRAAIAIVAFAGLAGAAVGPHLAVIFAGTIVATWAGWLLSHRRAPRPVPVTPVLVLALVPAYWLLDAIAGPIGLGTGALPSVPLSPAAESLVALALLLAGWSTAGLWPLHRQLPGALLGAVGAILLARTALPLAPGGLEQWRPLAVPVLMLGMCHAAAHGRWPLLAMGGAFLGLLTPAEAGAAGAWWLLGTAVVLELVGAFRAAFPLASRMRVVGWATGAWGGWSVLEGSLRGEVVYSALGALAIALLVVAPGRFDSSPGSVHIWPDDAS